MKKNLLIFLCCGLIALCGCSEVSSSEAAAKDPEMPVENSIFAMDTIMDFRLWGEHGDIVLSKAIDEIYRLEGLFSANLADSDIGQLNDDPTEEIQISQETAELIKTGNALSNATNGAIDLSIYPIVKGYGFPTRTYHVPTENELGSLLSLVNYRDILLDEEKQTLSLAAENMSIDVGAIAKGFTSDQIISLFKENGISSAMITLGGNVQVLGSKPDGSLWRVAVQDPVNENEYIGILEVKDTAVITSGAYQRYFDSTNQDGSSTRYHHIIDPATGKPANTGLASVTVVSESGILADGLSTALFVMGIQDASEYWRSSENFEVVFITDNGDVYITEGLEEVYSPVEEHSSYEIITK